MLTRNQHIIASTLRKSIGADFNLICSRPQGRVSQVDYLTAVALSQQATSQARYLAAHLTDLADTAAFLRLAGLR